MTGFVLLRVRAHRLLLAAALLAVLLTTSVLAALAAFSNSVGDAGLQRSLGSRDASAVALTVSSSGVPEAQRAEADEVVREAAPRTFDGLPTRVSRLDQSGSYALPRSLRPGASPGGEPDLTLFAGLERAQVRLTDGAWPKPAPKDPGEVIEVALPDNAAQQLKLTPGPTVLTLTDRLSGPARKVRITGLYEPRSLADPYWKLEDLNGRGVRVGSFTTYGPLLVDPGLLRSPAVSAGSVSWLVTADFSGVDTGRIDALRAAAVAGAERLTKAPPLQNSASVAHGLPQVLDQAERSLLVSRSTLLIVSLQLILLAGYALLLVARLLSTERAGETELLMARGGSRRRVVGLAAVEAALLALPAVLVAPLLAGPLARLLSGQGALGRIGLTLDAGGVLGSVPVRLVGLGVGLACAAAVVVPAITSGRGSRGRSVPAPLKAGADLALLLVAAVAYWQLDRQTSGSGPLSGDRGGDLGVDPLLVAAPALALLAGTVLTLRLLPPLARLAEKRAARGRGLPAALAGWQLSRRPMRGAGPVLLLVLAVAMGMLAIGQGASWDRSQEDQADFRSGASIRVSGAASSAGSGAEVPYASLPGVTSAAPAARRPVPLSGNRTATMLALDTAHASENLMLRGDLIDGDPDLVRRTAGLRVPDRNRPGIPLPDGDAFLLDASLRTDDGAASRVRPTLVVSVEDRYGLTHRLPTGSLTADGRTARLTVDVTRAVGRPARPLYLTGVEATVPQPYARQEFHELTLHAVRGADGGPGPAPKALRWQGHAVDLLKEQVGQDGARTDLTPGSGAGALLKVRYATGASPYPADHEYRYGAEATTSVRLTSVGAEPHALAAYATDAFLASSSAEVGTALDLDLNGVPLSFRIVGGLRHLPTTGPATSAATGDDVTPDGGGLLLDLRAVNQELTRLGAPALPPDEWWLATAPGRTADVASALRGRPDVDPEQVVVRDETVRELYDDPLGAGPQSALLAVAVVAALLAAVGFAVGAAGSLRERTAEFAVLKALGAPPRQLARLIAAEQSLLIGIALVVGLALGAVLTRAVVPLIVLTGQAAQPLPGVLVQLPAGQVALLLAGVVAVPLLVVLVLALRRGDPATTLRVHGGGN
ncbi:FtsX-like permease family protein [Streptomyces sp. CA-294286]|uniref:FtsX-like permease family protein n=1 Tax=Streptomyces sp. CA-294286 TaxID=3240070 RepID=UPI003D89E6FC